MKKYKFTILLLLTFVIAFPVITVKLVTAEQEKKARQEELAQVTGTEKEPAEAVAGTEENSTDKAGTGQADIDSTENTEDKTGIKDNETVADTEQEGTFTTEDVSAYTSYTFKPQLRTVGPKFGKYLGQIQKALAELDGNKAMAELKSTGALKLDSISDEVVLYEEDLLITMTQQEGYMTEGDNEVTVVLDTNLTPELLEEGMVRELISKIQTMRKEAGFEVMDKITVSYKADQKVKDIFAKYGEEIAKEVLAESVVADTVSGYQKEWNINGETVVLGVEKK